MTAFLRQWHHPLFVSELKTPYSSFSKFQFVAIDHLWKVCLISLTEIDELTDELSIESPYSHPKCVNPFNRQGNKRTRPAAPFYSTPHYQAGPPDFSWYPCVALIAIRSLVDPPHNFSITPKTLGDNERREFGTHAVKSCHRQPR